MLELFPQLERLKVLRTWTGLCDLSPDYSPILGRTELENFHVSAGWGTYGFKAAPIVGTTLAELVATGKTPELIAPFALERFHTDTLVSELAAAAVSHYGHSERHVHRQELLRVRDRRGRLRAAARA